MVQKWLQKTVLALVMVISGVQAENIPNPCELLTHQETEQLMGIPMKEGRLKDSKSLFVGMVCSYFSVSLFDKSGSIVLTIDTTKSMKETDSIYTSAKDHYNRQKNAYIKAQKDQNKLDSSPNIEGFGDDAYWNHVSLIILDKDTYLDIHVNAGAGITGKSRRKKSCRFKRGSSLYITKTKYKTLISFHSLIHL